VIVDDGSNEETVEATKNLDGVRAFYNAGNEGFIKSVRRGVSKSENKYVLILNSDVEATPKFIEAMAQNLDDGAAICGALLLYPQNHPYQQWRGHVQHAGIGFAADGIPYHVFAQFHPQSPAVQTWRSVNAVTGGALMVKREVWDKVGGFDMRLAPAVFEDVDLCLQVKKLKLEIIYEPKAVAWHYEHASQTQGSNWFNQPHLQKNLAYIFSKHGTPVCDDYLFYKLR
jgi:GT2 family glycosyltransferase